MTQLRYFYDHFEEIFCSVLLTVMIGSLSMQVLVRATTGGALAWAEELSRFSFIWAVYVGASLAAKKAAHVRITAQFLLAPLKVRAFFRILSDVIWVSFNIFFALFGIEMVAEAFAFPEVSPTLGVTRAYVEIIIPFAFAMMTWRTVENYIKNRHNLLEFAGTKELM